MKSIAFRFGGIGILVNDDSITRTIPFDELSIEDWSKIVNVNLTGTFIPTKAAARYLKNEKSASIVMISSGSIIHRIGGFGCICVFQRWHKQHGARISARACLFQYPS